MIQRIQTIYLLLGSILMLATVVTPFIQAQLDSNEEINGAGLSPEILVPGALAALLGLIAIFMFKNRNIQKLLSQIAMFLSIFIFLADAFKVFTIFQEGKVYELQPVLFFPLIAAVFFWLAVQGIKKDDALVKSMDRFR